MPKADTYISFIIDQLNKGVVEWKRNSSVFCGKFRLSEKTFDKYWKMANEKHREAQEAILAKKMRDNEEAALKANKANILQREKVVEMASNVLKIAYNRAVAKNSDDKQVYAFAAALEKFNKLEGLDKPTKQEIAIRKLGKDLADEEYEDG